MYPNAKFLDEEMWETIYRTCGGLSMLGFLVKSAQFDIIRSMKLTKDMEINFRAALRKVCECVVSSKPELENVGWDVHNDGDVTKVVLKSVPFRDLPTMDRLFRDMGSAVNPKLLAEGVEDLSGFFLQVVNDYRKHEMKHGAADMMLTERGAYVEFEPGNDVTTYEPLGRRTHLQTATIVAGPGFGSMSYDDRAKFMVSIHCIREKRGSAGLPDQEVVGVVINAMELVRRAKHETGLNF